MKLSSESNKPFFSIMIPVYNGEELVSQAIESVINQPYHGWELIIMNDGSTDRTQEICETYAQNDPRIMVFTHENVGLGRNRNLGFEKLSGRWAIFLDHDDLILDNFFTQELVDFLNICENNQIDLIVPARLVVDYDVKKAKKDHVFCDDIVDGGNKASWNIEYEFATLLYRTELLMRNHLRFNETKPEMESIFRHKAAHLARKVLFTDKFYFGVRRENPNSITNTWKYLNIIPVRFNAYADLEQWHLRCDKDDRLAYLDTKQRTISIVLEYIVHSLRQDISVSDTLAGLKCTGMHTYVKDCLKERKLRRMWMMALMIAPRLYLCFVKRSLRNSQTVDVQIYPDFYKSYLEGAENFPAVYSALVKELHLQK